MKWHVAAGREKALKDRMLRLGIRETDLIERFVRSGGPGGQHANKVSTCVYLRHIPTGIEIKCRKERSQALNRYHARRILIDRIEKLRAEKRLREKQRLAKLARQKRKRSRASKERMLRDKKKRADRKRLRRAVRENDG